MTFCASGSYDPAVVSVKDFGHAISNVDIPEQIRSQLAQQCRSRRTRFSGFTASAPCKWHPTDLRDPRCPANYFTDDGGWTFVADHIEQGWPIEKKLLKKPAGAVGDILLIPGVAPVKEIYVKLQLGSGNVIGRSFHESRSNEPSNDD